MTANAIRHWLVRWSSVIDRNAPYADGHPRWQQGVSPAGTKARRCGAQRRRSRTGSMGRECADREHSTPGQTTGRRRRGCVLGCLDRAQLRARPRRKDPLGRGAGRPRCPGEYRRSCRVGRAPLEEADPDMTVDVICKFHGTRMSIPALEEVARRRHHSDVVGDGRLPLEPQRVLHGEDGLIGFAMTLPRSWARTWRERHRTGSSSAAIALSAFSRALRTRNTRAAMN